MKTTFLSKRLLIFIGIMITVLLIAKTIINYLNTQHSQK